MENKKEKVFNIMGSEVVEGFACKPKVYDANKPIMHFKTQIFICDDERCKKANKNKDKASHLREILKNLKLEKGENRIKIVRTGCFGACRFRSLANIYENTNANGNVNNNAIWLKKVHKYDDEKWAELFISLSKNKSLNKNQFKRIPISKINEYEND